jgi:hypothetical protein
MGDCSAATGHRLDGEFIMSKLFACPLAGGKIDSDFCLEIQEGVDGITEPTIETEEFLEIEDCTRICGECKYHL